MNYPDDWFDSIVIAIACILILSFSFYFYHAGVKKERLEWCKYLFPRTLELEECIVRGPKDN